MRTMEKNIKELLKDYAVLARFTIMPKGRLILDENTARDIEYAEKLIIPILNEEFKRIINKFNS